MVLYDHPMVCLVPIAYYIVVCALHHVPKICADDVVQINFKGSCCLYFSFCQKIPFLKKQQRGDAYPIYHTLNIGYFIYIYVYIYSIFVPPQFLHNIFGLYAARPVSSIGENTITSQQTLLCGKEKIKRGNEERRRHEIMLAETWFYF